MELEIYNLKDNPFRIGPAFSPDEIIWAGFSDLKQEIERRISLSVSTSSSRIVLNWGRYGSGKTHAANYFTRTDAISKIKSIEGKNPAKSLKITLPRTSKDPVQAFFRSFLGQIGIKEIRTDLEMFCETDEGKKFKDVLEAINTDSIINNLFMLIKEAKEDILPDIEAYLFGDASKTILSKLGMPLGFKDDEHVVNFIGTYINLVTFNKALYSSFILWIDEFEDIDSLSKSSQDRTTTFFRQLFDKASSNLLLFLNFTPKTFYNIEDLSLTLGEALATRARTRIEFDIPNQEVAKHYIQEIMSNPLFRDSKNIKKDNTFFPFNESSIDYILDHVDPLSVRTVNEILSFLLEIGLMEEKSIIDEDFIDEWKSDIISWKQ